MVIVVGGSIPDLANYIKAHKLFENPAPLIGNSLFTAGGFLKLAGNAAEGFVYPDAIDPSRQEIHDIDAKLVKAYGDRLKNQAVALQAWEYVRLVCDAIKRAGSDDREKIRDAMEATKDFPIAIGPPGTTLTYSPARSRPLHQPRSSRPARSPQWRIRTGAALAIGPELAGPSS